MRPLLQSLRSRHLALAMRAALAAGLLVVLFQFVDIKGVFDAFARADLIYLLSGAILVVANIGLQIAKWRYFVRLVNPENSDIEIAASLLFGIALGTITPGQLGEFGGRALRHQSLPAGSVVGLTLVDKIQMMCVLGIGGTIGLVVPSDLPMPFGPLLIVLVSVCGFLFFFRSHVLLGAITRLTPTLAGHHLLKEFFESIAVFRRRDLMIAFLLSVAFYFVLFAQMFFFLNAFEPVSPFDAFLGFSAMMFVKSLLPISLGDLGIREGTSAYFFALCGVAKSTSVSAALLLFAINVLLPSMAGLVFIPKMPHQ